MKILWIFNHPAPYKINFFNVLGKKVDLTVIFERSSESDRDSLFYYQKASHFKCITADSKKLGAHNNYTGEVIRHIKKNPYDIVVVNGWSTFTEMKTISYLRKKRIPYVFAINGGIVKKGESALRKALKRKYIKGAAMYLSPDANSSSYLAYYGADPSRIKSYDYSTVFEKEVLEKPLSKEARDKAKAEKGYGGVELFVSAGQFITRKNDLELIRLWSRMPKEKHLLLIGSGPEERQYRELVAKLGLENVSIKQYVTHDALLKLFSIADASVFFTKEDIYGHVVNESLSQGCPVYSSTMANATNKLIADGENGYRVNVEDLDGCFKILSKPLDEGMREKAIATAKSNTIENMAERHYELFREYLGE